MEDDRNEEEALEAEKTELFQNLRQVEVSVANNIKLANRELVQTRYYKQFVVISKQGPVIFRNFFITIEQDKNSKISYHFRWLDKKLEMIDENMVVENGKMHVIPEFKDILGEIKVDMEKLIKENDKQNDRLKGISKKLNLKEAKKIFTENEQDEDAQKIEIDLAKQGENVKIGKHTQIKDNKTTEMIPGVFEKGKRHEVAEDKASGNHIIIEKEKGQYKKNEEIKTGRFTTKKIFIIESDGNQKEYEILEQIMNIESYSNKKILIQKDEDGELHIKIIQVTYCRNLREKLNLK